MSDSKTLAELAGHSGIPARTIRFYIARGLLDGPVKAGRGAAYTADHLARLEKIQELQAQGRTLSEIVHLLSDPPHAASGIQPAPCWQFAIEQDVMVTVRGDVSPWRMKQIRAAIDEMARRIGSPNEEEER